MKDSMSFRWLCGGATPDFRTINNFRSCRLKKTIEHIFEQSLTLLFEKKYIKMENYFCDGTTIEANANKNKKIWKKSAEYNKKQAEEKIKKLMQEIDLLNQKEEETYGKNDLTDEQENITDEEIKKLAEKVNKETEKKEKEIQKTEEKKQKYERQIKTAGERSGYSKTDEDAPLLRVKQSEDIKPAYNVMIGTENQFITGISVEQNPNDGTNFIPHIDKVKKQQPKPPENVIADAIFGTEENYTYLENNGIENHMKFPSYHAEQKKSFKNDKFRKENFSYDKETDTFTCPNNKKIILTKTYEEVNKRGFATTKKEYTCESCKDCPFYKMCCKSKEGKNRVVSISENLERYKQQTRENLKSERGNYLIKKRSIEVETINGDIKQNMGFRRFHLRGLKKVTCEITLVAMAHNFRKMAILMKNTA